MSKSTRFPGSPPRRSRRTGRMTWGWRMKIGSPLRTPRLLILGHTRLKQEGGIDMFDIIHVRHDQFPMLRAGEHITDSSGLRIELKAVVSPEAVDALMCEFTCMREAGPYREGRIRMRSS